MYIFDKIEEQNKAAMLSCIKAVTKEYPKGAHILDSEEGRLLIGVIETGSVQMVSEDFWGSRSLLGVLGSGDLIGETFACTLETNDMITFQAVSDCRILLMDYSRVLHTCDMACGFHHRLIENMVKIIAKKNMELLKKLNVISKLHLREKILTYLSQRAADAGNDTFTLPLGRTKMAEYLCTNRSALTRELSKMAEEGLISYDKNTFTLLVRSDR